MFGGVFFSECNGDETCWDWVMLGHTVGDGWRREKLGFMLRNEEGNTTV